MPAARPPSDKTLLVACLCANWCDTCREYQPLFTQLQTRFAGVQFIWIDIEDDADLVDPIEVENFPTLLIATLGKTLFFGTLTPHIETLQRLIQTHLAGDARALPANPDLDGLLHRLWQRVPGTH